VCYKGSGDWHFTETIVGIDFLQHTLLCEGPLATSDQRQMPHRRHDEARYELLIQVSESSMECAVRVAIEALPTTHAPDGLFGCLGAVVQAASVELHNIGIRGLIANRRSRPKLGCRGKILGLPGMATWQERS